MSFGFSVSDIVAGARLAYRVLDILSKSSKAHEDYHDTIASLNTVHKIFLQVEEIRATDCFSLATLNALLFAINSANDRMVTFLAKHEKYGTTFRPGGSGRRVLDFQRRVSWATQMPAEVEKLRKVINSTLLSISCLLQLVHRRDPYVRTQDAKMPLRFLKAPRLTKNSRIKSIVYLPMSQEQATVSSTFERHGFNIIERVAPYKCSIEHLEPSKSFAPLSMREEYVVIIDRFRDTTELQKVLQTWANILYTRKIVHHRFRNQVGWLT